jgi:hypothetical protein
MSGRFNVAQRLAEGAAAVEHTQTYVWACHVLGYQHPDLTAYASQIRDWYDSEDGLDLCVLDDDCAQLRAAANAADEALTRQRAQHAGLAEAWTGAGADAATEFLARHCRAAEALAANVAAAAQRCAALRDDLWRLVDAKAAAAIAIDDRRLAERPGWLAGAQTVLTGAGDQLAADDLVEQQMKPYVDNDIRADWLDAMRSTAASADASLDAATDAVTTAPGPRFEVPGDLAAQSTTIDERPAPAVDAVPVHTIPAEAARTVPSSAGPDSEAAPSAAPDAVPPPLPADPGSTPGDAGGFGDLGGLGGASGATGLGALGSSIGGIISQIVDAVGGLLGSAGDGATDPSLTDDPLDPDDPEDLEDQFDPQAEPAPENAAAPENPPEPPAQIEEAAPPSADPEPPTAESEPPTAEPPPPPADPEPDKTPCEIAADELPQAGQ